MNVTVVRGLKGFGEMDRELVAGGISDEVRLPSNGVNKTVETFSGSFVPSRIRDAISSGLVRPQ